MTASPTRIAKIGSGKGRGGRVLSGSVELISSAAYHRAY